MIGNNRRNAVDETKGVKLCLERSYDGFSSARFTFSSPCPSPGPWISTSFGTLTGLDPRNDTLYGLYEGIPLPERSVLNSFMLPDKITIFAEPLLRDFPNPSELREQIRITVLHEIAHYFGIEEEEIEELGY